MINTLYGPVEDPKPEVTQKPVDVWTTINSIHSKDYFFEEKYYTPWIVNKSLGSFPELLYYVQQMNTHHTLSPEMQYDYYFYSIPKQKRFKKWLKKTNNADNKNIETIATIFGLSLKKATIAWNLLTVDQKKLIIDSYAPDQKPQKNK